MAKRRATTSSAGTETPWIAEPLRALAVPIDDLTPDPANARRHPERNMAAIQASLRAYGQRKPLVVRRSGMVVTAGNGTLAAARALGWTHVAAVVVDDDAVTATGFALADNRTAELAEWDDAVLAGLLSGLAEEDVALADLGWDADDMAALTASLGEDADPPEDPGSGEPPAQPVSQRGEVYALGPHRLMCGDSTSAEDVNVLMGGERADVCVTDPPYSVNYQESHKERGGSVSVHAHYVEGATDADASDVLAFMAHVPADVMVWSYPIDRHFFALADAHREHGWEFRKELVWVKTNGFSFWPGAKYQQKHEPIMIAARAGKPIGGDVSATETTVRECAKPSAHKLHPTQKPMDLWEPLVRNHCPDGGVVYEPFCGSGTTLIAAARQGRRCYGMEISSAYCDVIRKRWGDYARGAGLDPGPDAL